MLESIVRATIRKEDLDIDYGHGQATNYFGTKYDVSISQAESCTDIPRVNYFQRKIELKTSCDKDVDQGHFIAHSLAHELGHSETYIGSNLLFAVIGATGIMHALKEKSMKTFFYTGVTLVSYKLVIEEAVAEFAASKLHGTTYMDFKGDISDLLNFCRHLIDLF